MSVFIDLLRSDGSIIINKNLINALGLEAAVLFGELLSKQNYYKKRNETMDGWFYETADMLEINTGLSYYQQRKSLETLINEKLIEVSVKGLPAKKYFKVTEDETLIRNILERGKAKKEAFLNKFNEEEKTTNILKTSFEETKELDSEKLKNKNFENLSVINNRINNNRNNKNTYIVENEENLTEKENIKEKESIRSSSKNTPSLLETSKNIETSKEKPTKKKPLKAEDKNKAIIEEVISYLNERTQKHFTSKNKQTIKFINGRLSEGYTIEDFKKVIDNRCEKWLNDEKMNEYLRPSTLFRPSNFEAYYNDVLSMKEKAISEKEQEFIEKFSIGLTPPNLTPKQALKVFKEENKINILGENDFKNLEEWYKMKIKDWNKKFTEKIKKESEVKIGERAKVKTNERAERYLRNFDKPRKLL